MVRLSHLSCLAALTTTVWAAIPALSGYRITWADDFNGPQGQTADVVNNWYQLERSRSDNGNSERQQYTSGPANAHLSGDGQLYIIPKKDASGQWTSANLQSRATFHCPAGKAMVLQAEIRVPDFTGSPAKFQGLWPAFWTLGKSFREGTPWPKCGEWDIMEVTNRIGSVNQGTLHFARPGSGPPYQDDGSHNRQVGYSGGEYHTWAIKIDRRPGNWRDQRIAWYRDGFEYFVVTGNDIGNFDQWEELAYKSYFAILNVAIGGGFAGGDPSSESVGGFESSMRVRYFAAYESL